MKNTPSFLWIGTLTACVAVASCDGTARPPAGDVKDITALSSALNLAMPGHGSGLLWRLSTNELRLWDTKSGGGDYEDSSLGAPESGWQVAGTGDFNGDGHGDIIWAHRNMHLVSEWLMNDTQVTTMTPSTANLPQYFAGPGVVGTGDLDGDGVSDMVWTGTVSQGPPAVIRTEMWFMNAGSTTPRTTFIRDSSTEQPIAVGNFDGDSGRHAEIMYQQTDNTVRVRFADDSSTIVAVAGAGYVVRGVGDFNGDATSDILWQNVTTGNLVIWMIKNGVLSASVSPGTVDPSTGFRMLGVADMDHDGITDIVWRRDDTLANWMMKSDGSIREFSPATPVPNGSFLTGVVELGPPAAPVNPRILSETLSSGGTRITLQFTTVPTRQNERITINEQSGQFSFFRGTLPYTVSAPPNVMSLTIDTAAQSFNNRTTPCFTLQMLVQNRLGTPTGLICAPGLAPPTAAFDWRVSELFGADNNSDGAIDLAPSVQALSSLGGGRWSTTLDACSSLDALAGGNITSYRWDIANLPSGSFTSTQPSCSLTMNLPQGTFPTTLTVTTADGRSAAVTKSVSVRNYLIVSLGDSYGSGEGNPLRNYTQTMTGGVGSTPVPAFWGLPGDARCHRDANAAPARAALAIEKADPHSSVTFLSVACSGAGIRHLIDTDYAGKEDIPGSSVNVPQIQQVKNMFCLANGLLPGCTLSQTPNIDAILLSIGGNDAGFGDLILNCALGDDGPLHIQGLCSQTPEIVNSTTQSIDHLSDPTANDPTHPTYFNLAARLAELNPKNVYITEYPDPTRFQTAPSSDPTANIQVCNEIVLKGALFDATFGASLLIGKTDATIGHDDLVWLSGIDARLNSSIASAVSQLASQRHWNYVGGISRLYGPHGYCADNHWIERYEESRQNQFNHDGTVHPNIPGHVAYAQQIVQALIAKGVGTSNAGNFIPAGNVLPQVVVGN